MLFAKSRITQHWFKLQTNLPGSKTFQADTCTSMEGALPSNAHAKYASYLRCHSQIGSKLEPKFSAQILQVPMHVLFTTGRDNK